MAEPKKEYAAVDVFKMFCAFLVMLIHTKPFDSIFLIDAGLGLVTRFAVPFFFTTSGYFFYKRITDAPQESNTTVRRYLFRLLRFYLIWFILLRIETYILNGSHKSIPYYVKQFFFMTDGSPLWFVPSLIWAILLVYSLGKIMKIKFVFAIGIVCLLIGYAFSTLLGITKNSAVYRILKPFTDFIGIQGGLFFAFPYVAMGALLATVNIHKQHIKDSLLVMLFFVMLGIESFAVVSYLNAPFTFLWICALPMTWFVTRLTLSIQWKSGKTYFYVRKTSTLFYVLHVVIYKIAAYMIDYYGIVDTMHLLLTILTFTVTTVVCVFLVYISEKKHFSWLKYAM